jgi:hypothetical protein
MDSETLVWSVMCAVVLPAASTSCAAASTAPLVPPVAPPTNVVAGADLGGGCTLDAPRILDRRTWAADRQSWSPAGAQTPEDSLTPFFLALGERRQLMLWEDGSLEGGYDLRARTVDKDSGKRGPPVTLSTTMIGLPSATPAQERGVRIWFTEGSDHGVLQVATTVHCSP